MKQKDDEVGGEANKETPGPCPKAEVYQGPEVAVVTDTQQRCGDGWRSWNAAKNGSSVCDGNAGKREREPLAATG